MLKTKYIKQSGLSLIELMVGLTVGLIVLSGVISIYIATITSSADTLKAAKLNQELSSALAIMVSDIRRAGYWGLAAPDDLNNPFMTATTNIDILNTKTCILYTHDLDSNGTVSPTTEYFGFKLSTDKIQMRTGTGTTTADCTDGDWEDITNNKNVEITSVVFSTTGSSCLNTSRDSDSDGVNDNWTVTTSPSDVDACDDAGATNYVAPTTGDLMLESRKINITLTGRLVSDNTVTKTITETFKVRNDYIFSAP
jgi:type IV pilus assembly protein PilW